MMDHGTDAPAIPSNMKELPSELRDEIYSNLIPEIEAIEIPHNSKQSLLSYLGTQLPTSLKDDPEMADEATMVLLRSAIRTVKRIKVPGPELFNLPTLNSMMLESVRYLEFTTTQHMYASNAEANQHQEETTIHDVVMRCPNLEKLTIHIGKTMMATTLEGSTEVVVPHDTTQILRILEHPKVTTVVLNCDDATQPRIVQYYDGRYQRDVPYSDFLPFTESFKKAVEEQGREIDLLVDLTPGVVKDPRDFEQKRPIEEGFTWIEQWDFWGM